MTCGRELELKLLKDLPLANGGNSSLSDSDFACFTNGETESQRRQMAFPSNAFRGDLRQLKCANEERPKEKRRGRAKLELGSQGDTP